MPSASTMTPNSLPSASRASIALTITSTSFSMFRILRVVATPVLGSVSVSSALSFSSMSSTLMTRLASPAMAAP